MITVAMSIALRAIVHLDEAKRLELMIQEDRERFQVLRMHGEDVGVVWAFADTWPIAHGGDIVPDEYEKAMKRVYEETSNACGTSLLMSRLPNSMGPIALTTLAGGWTEPACRFGAFAVST